MDLKEVNTIRDAQRYVEGCVNDYEAGISTKDELLGYLGGYTARIMEVFWNTTKGKVERAFKAGRGKTTWEQFQRDENIS